MKRFEISKSRLASRSNLNCTELRDLKTKYVLYQHSAYLFLREVSFQGVHFIEVLFMKLGEVGHLPFGDVGLLCDNSGRTGFWGLNKYSYVQWCPDLVDMVRHRQKVH